MAWLDAERAQQGGGGLRWITGLAQHRMQTGVDQVIEHLVDDAPRVVCLFHVAQPTEGPSPSDWGVVESGEGCGSPPARSPISLMMAPDHGGFSSATRVFVVSTRPAIDAAFRSAERVTSSGSTIPKSTMSPYRPT